MIYTASAAGAGTLHRIECGPGPGDSGRTRFDGGAWLEWPAAGRDVRLAASGAWLLAVAKGQQGPAAGGRLIVGNQHGTFKVISDVSGEFAVGVEPLADGLFRVACVLPGQMTWRTWLVTGDLLTVVEESTQDVPPECPGTSQGWTEFKDGQPTWKDIRPNVVLGGVLFSEPSRAGRWTVGLSNRDFGVDAYDHDQQRVVRVWSGNTSVRPSIASLEDGRALVAICSDSGAFVSSSEFDANWVPPVEPVAVPTFEPKPISCVPFDAVLLGPDVPQVVGGGGEDFGDIRYVFFTVGQPGEHVGLTTEKAAKHGAKTMAYYDKPFRSLVPDGADVIGNQCYPHGKQSAGTLESLDALRDRLNANREAIRQSGRAHVNIVPVYNGSGEWPLEHVFACQQWAWADGVDVLPYGHHRPPFIDAIKESLRRMLAAATAPKPVVVPPVVVPPVEVPPVTPPVTPPPTPVPVPVPPTPKPPKKKAHPEKYAGAIVAGLAALFAWLRKK